MIPSSKVRDLIESTNSAYWQIMYSRNKSGSKIFSSLDSLEHDDEPIDLESSLQHLDSCMENLMPGKYTIRYWNDPKKSARGFGEVVFVVEGQTTNGNAAIGNHGLGIYGNNIGAVIEEKVQAALDRKELEELRTEVEEYRKANLDPTGNQSAIAKVVETVTNMPGGDVVISGLLKGIVGIFTPRQHPVISNGNWPNEQKPISLEDEAAQALFGTHQENSTQDAVLADLEAHENEYAEVLYRLRTHVPNLLPVLQKLAEKAEANPAGFNSKLGFIDML